MYHRRLVASFHEPSDEDREPRGGGWRRIEPHPVRIYVANGWHDAVAVNVNDDTREIRVEWPPRTVDDPLELVMHRVLSADHYELGAGDFPPSRGA
jgi:hypothetical protein